MTKSKKLKVFNDPIYGFITIPDSLIFRLIEHPYFQRLRRISQMGLSHLVYPGAQHTRFHHALGSMHLMQQAVQVLRFKGVGITPEEEQALYCAILLHDIGHGPFSHAMEHSIVDGMNHEYISIKLMHALNETFNGKLTLAIKIFMGEYPKSFLNQLVASQLDMDRLDYLKRDSFYTGVAEGNINAERLITMLNVSNGTLVIEEKGIYSVEKFLMARRFMYWQVYLHKTGIVAEQLLIRILRRAKELLDFNETLECSASFRFFLENKIGKDNFDRKALHVFSKLDDVDLLSGVKAWVDHPDFILSNLCKMVLNRRLLKIKVRKKPVHERKLEKHLERVKEAHGLNNHEAGYFVFTGEIDNTAYDRHNQNINILKKNGTLVDAARASDQLNLKALSKTVTKYYICYPKDSV